jgi:hypothetical protein
MISKKWYTERKKSLQSTNIGLQNLNIGLLVNHKKMRYIFSNKFFSDNFLEIYIKIYFNYLWSFFSKFVNFVR